MCVAPARGLDVFCVWTRPLSILLTHTETDWLTPPAPACEVCVGLLSLHFSTVYSVTVIALSARVGPSCQLHADAGPDRIASTHSLRGANAVAARIISTCDGRDLARGMR